MRRYIGLHVFSILLTLVATITSVFTLPLFLPIVSAYRDSTSAVPEGGGVVIGLIFISYVLIALLIAIATYVVAALLAGIGWGLRKRQGSPYLSFVIETIIPTVLLIVISLIIFGFN